MNNVTDIARKDFGSIDHRRELAGFYGLDEQEVLDLPKREFKTLVIGIIKGKLQGKFEATEDIKSKFFCVPIQLWEHREEDFKKILKEEINEIAEANKKRNDDSAAEGVLDAEGNSENPEEL